MGPNTATNLKILGTVVVTLGIYTWVANAIPQLESEVPEEISFSGEVTGEELATVGEELFVGAGGCTACHGTGTRAPNLRTDHEGEGAMGARCEDRAEGQTCKDYLWEAMVDPGAHLVEGFGNIMPPQDRILTSNQIWAIVAYLQSLGGEITVTGADLESGGGESEQAAAGVAGGSEPGASLDPVALLQNNTCLGCHTLGDQGMDLGPSFNGIGSRLSEEVIRESIVDPGAQVSEGYEQLLGSMPPTFGQMLSDEELDAIVEYLAAQE